jgi:RimJ/RimL family protein N-acetyltransferase
MILIPYINIDGTWTLPDDVMRGLYQLIVHDETDKVFFYGGMVRNGDDFIQACRNNSNPCVVLEDNGDPVAIAWLNNLEGKSAHAHWIAFKRVWGTGKAQEAATRILKYWFGFKYDGIPLFEVIVGVYPDNNKFIDNFVRKLGFTIIGNIPHLLQNNLTNRSMGANIAYVERSMYVA